VVKRIGRVRQSRVQGLGVVVGPSSSQLGSVDLHIELAPASHVNPRLSRTESEGIHRSLVIGPLVSQGRLELDIDRLKVDARYGYFAIFVQRGRKRSRRFSRESWRDDGQIGRIHFCGWVVAGATCHCTGACMCAGRSTRCARWM
jgi:hypothetical protein